MYKSPRNHHILPLCHHSRGIVMPDRANRDGGHRQPGSILERWEVYAR